MSSDKRELIEAARSVVGKFNLQLDFTAGAVAAALRTVDGNIYTGICIDITCGLGFCAEVSAIAQMLIKRETQIIQIVAVGKTIILPPCGRCRETIAQVDGRNLDCQVIVSDNEEVPLRELLPRHWLDSKKLVSNRSPGTSS